jgi:uncharacterized damage-inducible protein DinB
MQLRTPVLAAGALALSLAAFAPRVQGQATAAPTGFKADVIASIEDAEKKLVQLAEKFPQEKYAWHPEGARSTSEVLMHIASGNYTYGTFIGGTRPEGTAGAVLMKITDKPKVIEALKSSFVYVKAAIQGASDLDKPVKIFGRDATVREAMLRSATHSHEHMGQLIAYARVNGIVPPWSEEQAARPPAKN